MTILVPNWQKSNNYVHNWQKSNNYVHEWHNSKYGKKQKKIQPMKRIKFLEFKIFIVNDVKEEDRKKEKEEKKDKSTTVSNFKSTASTSDDNFESIPDSIDSKILVKCQINALTHVSQIARIESIKALEKGGILMKKCQRLGITEAQITHCLSFIRDEMQLMVHVSFKTLEKLITDTHYRNMFETGHSCGTNDHYYRNQWENLLFGNAYENSIPFDRCKYGCLNTNISNHPNGSAIAYGDNYFTLKPHMRSRITCCNNDSSDLCDQRLVGTLDNYAHILAEFKDDEINDFVTTICSRNSKQIQMQYKEIQIHGPLVLSDFETLVINRRYEYTEKIGLFSIAKKIESLGIKVIESDP